MAIIEIKNVYKIFGPTPHKVLDMVKAGAGKDEVLAETGHTVGLRDVSLSIEAGKTFVVMGLSGSGKSTLIRHINRLIDPTAGEIVVDGVNVMELSPKKLREFRRQKLSMVFQRFGLLPHLTVLDNVAYGLKIQDVSKAEREQKAAHWIEAVGLSGYEGSFPDELSGGMQQRVGLARALATDADILLMDEAFSALDPLIRRDMQDQLIELQEKLHKTIVFITHDLDEALRLGDRIAILKDGEVVQVGGAEEILLNPADEYVGDFVKDVNRGLVVTAETIARQPSLTQPVDRAPADALASLEACPHDVAYVLDSDKRLKGVLTLEGAKKAMESGGAIADSLSETPTATADMVVQDLLPLTLEASWPLPVVDEDGVFVGIVSRRTAIDALTIED